MIDRFMTGGGFEAHLERNRGIYRGKCNLMIELMERHLPDSIRFVRPQGGLFLWCQLPDSIDMPAFAKRAVERYKVAVVPGNAFLTDESQPCNAVRLNFSTPTDEQMVKGMELLGKCFADFEA